MSLLSGLRNGQNTDLHKGTIRNADAVLLLLNERGGSARGRDIKAALREWRPGLAFGYLFQSNFRGSGYGFCGTSILTESYRIRHAPSFESYGAGDDGHESTRRTYYYRVARGFFAITAEGYRRLEELGVPRHTSAC